MKKIVVFSLSIFGLFGCKKNTLVGPTTHGGSFTVVMDSIPGSPFTSTGFYDVPVSPGIKIYFSAPVDPSTVASSVVLTGNGSSTIPISFSYDNGDSILIVQPVSPLADLTHYGLSISEALRSMADSALKTNVLINMSTGVDSTDKFPQISDTALLTLVEQQTFNYFWTFGHAVSGMARERTSSGDVVTTGGSGFGVMSMLVGVQRNFISRSDALGRITEEVNFLTNNASRYHGAFPHWMNGTTGETIPFSTQDDGGDIVETSYMMQGLLCARQYFNSTTDSNEINLRSSINNLWMGVDWNWYRQNGQNSLTWNWSPDYNWYINDHITGWCEAMIAYVLAASDPVDTAGIPKSVYDDGWAQNGNEKNGNSYFGVTLPLGPQEGGPLFFAHYSFLGINPTNLTDAYANYWTQDTAHSKINYLYCVSNPGHFYAYGPNCWGLTASDENDGYSAHSPTNDDGVISPTAAISSLPYTPTESMNALRFFYYKLGNRAWGQYGFTDAFNLTNIWFDSDCLAIDQGPEIIMIENYRSGLLWNLFMSCPEIQTGMLKLGFQSPNL